jgi:hypothetical protein
MQGRRSVRKRRPSRHGAGDTGAARKSPAIASIARYLRQGGTSQRPPPGELCERVLGTPRQAMFGARARIVTRVGARKIDHRHHARGTRRGQHAVVVTYLGHRAAYLAGRTTAPAGVIVSNARLVLRASWPFPTPQAAPREAPVSSTRGAEFDSSKLIDEGALPARELVVWFDTNQGPTSSAARSATTCF